MRRIWKHWSRTNEDIDPLQARIASAVKLVTVGRKRREKILTLPATSRKVAA